MQRLALIFLIVAVPACFNDHIPPPTFRFTCEDDDECEDEELCVGGLCQVPCTQLTGAEDCPSQLGYVGCFNGVCTNLCQPPEEDEDDSCPDPQECLDLGISIDEEGNFGGSTSTAIGLCIAECDDDDCPQGEVCVEGLCAISCEDESDCPDGQTCFGNICIPEEVPEDRSIPPGTTPAGEQP